MEKDIIKSWQPGVRYKKKSIVRFLGRLWTVVNDSTNEGVINIMPVHHISAVIYGKEINNDELIDILKREYQKSTGEICVEDLHGNWKML